MTRPADVTDEKIAQWLERAGPRPDRAFAMTPEMLAASDEITVAGYWLEEKLGLWTQLSKEEQVSVLMSTGQISFGREPWEVAQTVLFIYKNGGTIPLPGRKLADLLMRGLLDGIFGLGPGGHSPEAIERMKKALGVTDLREILARTGSTNAAEASAKLKAEIETMEREEGFSRGDSVGGDPAFIRPE